VEDLSALRTVVDKRATRETPTFVQVPRDQCYRADWDLSLLAGRWHITILEVAMLEEVYLFMTVTGR